VWRLNRARFPLPAQAEKLRFVLPDVFLAVLAAAYAAATVYDIVRSVQEQRRRARAAKRLARMAARGVSLTRDDYDDGKIAGATGIGGRGKSFLVSPSGAEGGLSVSALRRPSALAAALGSNRNNRVFAHPGGADAHAGHEPWLLSPRSDAGDGRLPIGEGVEGGDDAAALAVSHPQLRGVAVSVDGPLPDTRPPSRRTSSALAAASGRSAASRRQRRVSITEPGEGGAAAHAAHRAQGGYASDSGAHGWVEEDGEGSDGAREGEERAVRVEAALARGEEEVEVVNPHMHGHHSRVRRCAAARLSRRSRGLLLLPRFARLGGDPTARLSSHGLPRESCPTPPHPRPLPRPPLIYPCWPRRCASTGRR
jgi:hypothetical protein